MKNTMQGLVYGGPGKIELKRSANANNRKINRRPGKNIEDHHLWNGSRHSAW